MNSDYEKKLNDLDLFKEYKEIPERFQNAIKEVCLEIAHQYYSRTEARKDMLRDAGCLEKYIENTVFIPYNPPKYEKELKKGGHCSLEAYEAFTDRTTAIIKLRKFNIIDFYSDTKSFSILDDKHSEIRFNLKFLTRFRKKIEKKKEWIEEIEKREEIENKREDIEMVKQINVAAGKELIKREAKGETQTIASKDNNNDRQSTMQLPKGTEWHSVTFKFLSIHEMEILLKGEILGKVDYKELGFIDSRPGMKDEPDEKWILLLKFVGNKGELSTNLLIDKDRVHFRAKKKVMCARLRKFFGMKSSPFHDGIKSGPEKGLHQAKVKLIPFPKPEEQEDEIKKIMDERQLGTKPEKVFQIGKKDEDMKKNTTELCINCKHLEQKECPHPEYNPEYDSCDKWTPSKPTNPQPKNQ